ncbi:hypothetical protein RRG08_015261 [Elysia crispata]|uniref:Uncharacterized protein n=1 Tax=Elysia crispata TaxID=231223 RepID=A0AAE1ASX7_9GAST|nr:hypothetical protein RRG08_015261 [Elysia crispata]
MCSPDTFAFLFKDPPNGDAKVASPSTFAAMFNPPKSMEGSEALSTRRSPLDSSRRAKSTLKKKIKPRGAKRRKPWFQGRASRALQNSSSFGRILPRRGKIN